MINVQESPNIVPSGYRILYVLLLLVNGKFSQNEINDKLACHPSIEQAFTKDTLLKIIKTLKAAGIKISKKENKYFISQFPWHLDLSLSQVSLLFDLGSFVRSLGQEELFESYKLFLQNMSRYLPENKSLTFFKDAEAGKKSVKYQKYLMLIKKLEQAKKTIAESR